MTGEERLERARRRIAADNAQMRAATVLFALAEPPPAAGLWPWACVLCREWHAGYATRSDARDDWYARHRCDPVRAMAIPGAGVPS